MQAGKRFASRAQLARRLQLQPATDEQLQAALAMPPSPKALVLAARASLRLATGQLVAMLVALRELVMHRGNVQDLACRSLARVLQAKCFAVLLLANQRDVCFQIPLNSAGVFQKADFESQLVLMQVAVLAEGVEYRGQARAQGKERFAAGRVTPLAVAAARSQGAGFLRDALPPPASDSLQTQAVPG